MLNENMQEIVFPQSDLLIRISKVCIVQIVKPHSNRLFSYFAKESESKGILKGFEKSAVVIEAPMPLDQTSHIKGESEVAVFVLSAGMADVAKH